MNKEREQPEPTIIELLNHEMKKGANNPDEFPTVEGIAERMGIDGLTLQLWLEQDNQFKEGLQTVKQTYDNDPWKDTDDEEIKLGAAVLSFGVVVVLERRRKDTQYNRRMSKGYLYFFLLALAIIADVILNEMGYGVITFLPLTLLAIWLMGKAFENNVTRE